MTYNVNSFYIGQKVIAVDAMSKSLIKNGTIYTVDSWEQVNGYWYIGVEGSHNRLRPSIFAPIEEKMMEFSKLAEHSPIFAN